MRPVLLALGIVALAAVWLSPLRMLLPGAFSAHMTMHMGVVAVAAPLIALGIAGSKLDPVRLAPALFSPIPISVVELVVVWSWHAPGLHHVAGHSMAGFVAEQSCFLMAGLLVWLSAFGGTERDKRNRQAMGVVALLLTSMHMTLLGALLALPPRALYAHAGHDAEDGGLALVADQHLGGAIMLVVGGVSYLAGGLWLTFRLLGTRHGEAVSAP